MHPAIPILAIGALVAAFGETPPVARDKVVLLPDADGRVGQVVVATPAGAETTLDRAYATADVMSDGKIRAGAETREAIERRYADALAARPPAPVSFYVFFVFDKDELTPESIAQFDRIKQELAARPAPEILVIGHTDRVGSRDYNDALSLKRAETVRAALVAAGIDGRQIEVAGRGEREPAVATADEVDEPRNRRVEITVR
jgi:outer membrane protein OmpA-like peptidoglycan-associated protein